eukprot:3108105-Pleurochrysis_carterae.AAC.3
MVRTRVDRRALAYARAFGCMRVCQKGGVNVSRRMWVCERKGAAALCTRPTVSKTSSEGSERRGISKSVSPCVVLCNQLLQDARRKSEARSPRHTVSIAWLMRVLTSLPRCWHRDRDSSPSQYVLTKTRDA